MSQRCLNGASGTYRQQQVTAALSTCCTDQSNVAIPRGASLSLPEEPRFCSRFDMLLHSIRPSSTLSLWSGKTKCVLGCSADSVWFVSRVCFFYIITLIQSARFLIRTINTVRLCVLLWPNGLRRRSVDPARDPGSIPWSGFILFFFYYSIGATCWQGCRALYRLLLARTSSKLRRWNASLYAPTTAAFIDNRQIGNRFIKLQFIIIKFSEKRPLDFLWEGAI